MSDFKKDVLAVMRVSKVPLQAREIALVLGAEKPGPTVGQVAYALTVLQKEGHVFRRMVGIGPPVHAGKATFYKDGSTSVWLIKTDPKRWVKLMNVRTTAEIHRTLPKATLVLRHPVNILCPTPGIPVEVTQKLQDIQDSINRAFLLPNHLL